MDRLPNNCPVVMQGFGRSTNRFFVAVARHPLNSPIVPAEMENSRGDEHRAGVLILPKVIPHALPLLCR